MNEHTTENDRKKGFPTWIKVIFNLILMGCAGVVLIWLTTQWFDIWTRHGQEIEMPSVKGMSLYAAQENLEAEGFEVELADSIYDAKVKPGYVVEQNPKVGSRVKKGCTVYLSINAFAPRQVLLPGLTDISFRQAKSVLDGLGITNVRVDTVPSDYQGLVLAVKRDGRRLMPGARIPINASIVLEVGAGMPEEILNSDSLPDDQPVMVENLNLL